ncbi:MAG: YHS domain-containing (seleno)protein [Pseudomonadota bacterium]
MNRLIVSALASLAAIGAYAPVASADAAPAPVEVTETDTSWYGDGIAVSGKDVVSYFNEDQPVEGSEVFSTTWQNAEWQFSSQENLEAFEENPEQYAPQFGGYCPNALALGELKVGTPEQFAVIDEKLYLNYNYESNLAFRNDTNNLIARANVNWGEVITGR